MALIIRADGVITNPIAKLPDTISGLQLRWRAADLSLANGAPVTAWAASHNVSPVVAGDAEFRAIGGSGVPEGQLPTFIANASGGVPAVRSISSSRGLAACYRQQAAPGPENIHFMGDDLTFTLLLRWPSFQDVVSTTTARIFASVTSAQAHGARPGSGALGRIVPMNGDNGPVAPYPQLADLGVAPGHWFTFSQVYDKAAGQIRTVVNNNPMMASLTGLTLDAGFSSLSIVRSSAYTDPGNPGRESFAGDYADIILYNRALSLDDIHERHAMLRSEYGLPA